MMPLPQRVRLVLASSWLAPVCVLGASVAALCTRVAVSLAAHTDSARDLLLARVCQDDVCPMLGAPASLKGVFQGGWWVLHLGLLEMVGLEPGSIFTSGLFLNFAALALFGWALHRIGGSWCAAVGILVAAVANLWMESYWTQLWNPLLTPFFCTGFALALLAAVRGGTLLSSLAAVVFLAMAIQTHPAALVLLAPWSVVVAVRFERRVMLVSAITGVAVLALGAWVFSKDAIHLGVQAAAEQGFGLSVLLPSLLGAGWLWATLLMGLRFWWRRSRWKVFRLGWLPLHVGNLLAMLVLLGGWASGLHDLLQDRYLAPLLPLVAASAGLAVSKINAPQRMRANSVAAWFGALFPFALALVPLVLVPFLPDRAGSVYDWSYAHAEVVQDLVERQMPGSSYQQALATLRAPNRSGLMLGLTRLMPVSAAADSARESSADGIAQSDEVLNLGVSSVAGCGAGPDSGLTVAKVGSNRWLCGYRSMRHLDWSRVWLRWAELEGDESWYPFTLQPQAPTQHVPSPTALSDVQLPGRTSWVEAWVPVVGSFARPVRLVATGGCQPDGLVQLVAVSGLPAQVITQREVVVWPGANGAAPQQAFVLVRFLPTQGEMLADHQIQPAIWEGPADAPAFNLFLESVSCLQDQAPEEAHLTVAPPPPAHFPKPSPPAVSPACSGTFGVACLQLHTLCPIRFPFTVAVLLYLISVLATGWAWAVSLRVLSSSEWTERR